MLDLHSQTIVDAADACIAGISQLPLDQKVAAINELKKRLHDISPFRAEPVDCVLWVKAESVTANDYNPNSVAPPEMKLLQHSIVADGYTQPIVTWPVEGGLEVIDGFHRNRVGKESKEVRKRIHGYLPVTVVNADRTERNDRIASTIRHNRARGKHKVEAMSDIVVELKRRNWTDEKIARELGMDSDEVLRLCQITGLAEMFTNVDFSKAWEIGEDDGAGGEVLSDETTLDFDDKGRVFHTWEKWECFKAGFYEDRPPKGMSLNDGEERYRQFLADLNAFEAALEAITTTWRYSTEHYLTNDRMNRIAWLGQASVAYALGIPSCCRAGYHRLTDTEKYLADQMALKWLNRWRKGRGEPPLMLADAQSKTEADLY